LRPRHIKEAATSDVLEIEASKIAETKGMECEVGHADASEPIFARKLHNERVAA
jgi:hypothetical protein